MFSFIRYILRNECRKITTWAIPLIGSLLYILTAYLLAVPKTSDIDTLSFIEKGNIYTFIIIFAASTVFVGVKSISIFSGDQITGEEVIFCSKPITRMKRIVSKFIVLWILIALISFIFFISSFITREFDTVASSSLKNNYSFSILIGNTIILLIISSVMVLISIHFNIKFTLMFILTLSTVLPVISLTLTSALRGGITKSNIFQKYIKPSNSIIKLASSGGTVRLFDNDENSIYLLDEKSKKIINNPTANPYSTVAYFDLWEQFSNLYSLTYKNYYSLTSKKWDEKISEFNIDKSMASLEFEGVKYGVLLKSSTIYGISQMINQENFRLILEKTKGYLNLKKLFSDLIHSKRFSFNTDSFIKQLIYTHKISKEFDLKGTRIANISNINPIGGFPNAQNITDEALAQEFKDVSLNDYWLWDSLKLLNIGFKPATKLGFKSPDYTTFNNKLSKFFNLALIKDGSKINTVIPKPYINRIFLYTFWTITAIIFIIIAIISTYKKDYI